MVIAAGRQVDDLLGRRGDLCRAVLIGKGNDGVGIGHIKFAIDQRHAKGRSQPGQEGRLRFGDAIAIVIAQQRDTVGAWTSAPACFEQAHEQAAEAETLIRLRRCVAFGHQHIAVGQHMQPARMIQPGGKFVHRHSVGGLGHSALRPWRRLGDVYGRQQRRVRLCSVGSGP